VRTTSRSIQPDWAVFGDRARAMDARRPSSSKRYRLTLRSSSHWSPLRRALLARPR
jgi:hypothetical protein